MKKSLYTLALIVLFAGCNFPWGKSGKKKEAKEQVIHAALPTIDVKVITSLEDFEKEISN